jgi:hypothetical protein
MPKLMNKLAGAKFKLVLGYPGTTGAMLAMERGEVEGAHATAENLVIGKPDWLRDKTVSVLVQYSEKRHRAFPDVPAMVELGKTAEDKQIRAVRQCGEIGRAILTPPGAEGPARRVAPGIRRDGRRPHLHRRDGEPQDGIRSDVGRGIAAPHQSDAGHSTGAGRKGATGKERIVVG